MLQVACPSGPTQARKHGAQIAGAAGARRVSAYASARPGQVVPRGLGDPRHDGALPSIDTGQHHLAQVRPFSGF